MNFIKFRDAVNKQIENMVNQDIVLEVSVDRDTIWETYLGSFPEGTNELFRERTEHDCNCCKNFIRDVGNMVTVKGGKLVTIWDIKVDDEYQVVADTMAKKVRGSKVTGPFRHREKKVGHKQNFDVDLAQYDHFYTVLPSKLVDRDPGTYLGNCRSNYNVLKRSLEEISDESVDIVNDLIAQNALYRGAEHKRTIQSLVELKKKYKKIKGVQKKQLFLWVTSLELGMASKIRNTVIGTLLTDLTEGVDLEKAVKSFEDKVAPANYKRTTALITQGMIDKAQKKIEELGLEDALHRRYAVEEDVTINNVLFADRDAQKRMKGSVFDDLKPTSGKEVPKMDKIQEIGVEQFINDVLPKAETLELFVENKHEGNLMSVIAPVYEDAGNIFKWDNNFSWSYNGDITDSELRQSVQGRGGSVSGVFRFSHMWNYDKRNASLMDLHVFMPGSTKKCGNGINDAYGNHQRVGWNQRKHVKSRGVQDVDYTNRAPEGYVPVENITFPKIELMPEGEYRCMIHNWDLRQPTQGGFKAEIEFGGEIYEYEVARPLKHKEWIEVATVTLKDGCFSIKHHLPCGSQSKEIWGVSTQQFQKVKMVMLSPNHWDDKEIGNKHWFFILDNCTNPEKARGFYNEFLRNDLTEHRKVFETLGSKMKTEESDNQLSGVGFSSTKQSDFIVKVGGSFNRTLKVKV